MDGYKNIGDSYTASFGNFSISYNQNEAASFTELVIDQDKWETQSDKINPDGCAVCCAKISRKIMAKVGRELGGAFNSKSIGMVRETGTDENRLTKTENYQRGLNEINTSMGKGEPVMIGVDHSPGSGNVDDTTDHFMVIAGRTINLGTGEVSYRYYDPGTGKLIKEIMKTIFFG